MDANKAVILPVLEQCYGPKDALAWFNRWRVFYLSVAELFNYPHAHTGTPGDEWGVVHWLIERKL
jgi:hypothetical protein